MSNQKFSVSRKPLVYDFFNRMAIWMQCRRTEISHIPVNTLCYPSLKIKITEHCCLLSGCDEMEIDKKGKNRYITILTAAQFEKTRLCIQWKITEVHYARGKQRNSDTNNICCNVRRRTTTKGKRRRRTTTTRRRRRTRTRGRKRTRT